MPPLDPQAYADVLVQAIKSALGPVLADVKALQSQIAAWDASWNDIGALRERVAVVEAKAATPLPAPPDDALVDLRARLSAVEAKAQGDTAPTDIAGLRERVAVLETRAPVPGPAGADGANGKDGADGLGFDDLSVDFDGDRTLALKFSLGGVLKTFPIALPFLRYQGVFSEGKSYTTGDVVTWGGSTWTANEPTSTKPGDGSKAWTLAVKKGRDGRDGRDALDPVPVVKVGR